MAKLRPLRQIEPVKETIGEYNFYIRPFPAMVAANMTGDLAAMLAPVLAALFPLVENEKKEDKEGKESDLLDINVDQAAASMAKCLDGFSGDKVEFMMKKLLITHKNITIEYPEFDENGNSTGKYDHEILDMDMANEIFCGELQDMFILAFYVIRLNFNGFFKKIAGRSGKAGEELRKKMRQMF